jgi:TonB family protein
MSNPEKWMRIVLRDDSGAFSLYNRSSCQSACVRRFVMKKLMFAGFLPFLSAFPCMGQTQQSLCPKHIETPTYPSIARSAHVSGLVVLTLTIDADGKVGDVKVTNEDQRFVKLLERSAVGNIRLWTFTKPQSAPSKQNVTYDFQLDDKLPLAGVNHYPDVTLVTYDLPDRVTIRTNN